MATLSADEWRFERTRLRMVLSIPELRAAQFEEYRRTVAALTQADCRRTGREPDDFEVRVFVGALGGLMAGAGFHGSGYAVAGDRRPILIKLRDSALIDAPDCSFRLKDSITGPPKHGTEKKPASPKHENKKGDNDSQSDSGTASP